MKRSWFALLLTALLCLPLTACGQKAAALPGEYPMMLDLSSGAGSWCTSLTLNADGTFSGRFSDCDLGVTGPDYPDGTVYLRDFTGRFEVVSRIDDNTTALRLVELTCEQELGHEEIKEGRLYIYSDPVGLVDDDNNVSEDFILYAPATPAKGLDETLLLWWSGHHQDPHPPTLGVYCLWNPSGESAFFA